MKNKQNLLIISPTTPKVNTNAGDWRVFTLIKELSNYYNIFFMPLRDNPSGKKHLKTLKNIQVITNMKSTNKFSCFVKQNNIEMLLIEKYWDLPFDVYKYIPLVKTSVIDVHEIGFKKSDARSKIEKIENNKVYKAKELLFYSEADILISISAEERKELKKYFPNKKIIIIPTCTDVKKTDKNFSQRKDICYFGFFGYKPNTDAVNYFIKNIFPKFLKNNPKIKFYVLGKGSALFKGKHKNIVIKENIKDIPKELSKYRVLVCPLRYGAGVKKKVLDAMASKTPVVSTNFGYEGIVGMRKAQVTLNSDKFIEKIQQLYCNKTIWNKISNHNFEIVKKHYSMSSFKQYVQNFIKHL